MKILVTGGNGFIGQYVVEQLLESGYKVAIFDRKLKMKNFKLNDNVEHVFGSITDPVAVHEAMSEVDGFIHLASVLGTQETIKNPVPAVHTNILGGLNILEASTHFQVPGINITVGNWWMNNTYSIAKNMTERFVHMYNKERGTKISNVRVVNAYGPRQSVAAPFGESSVRKIMPSFICRALTGRDIEVYGDGSQVSDIVFVEDVARIIVMELASVIQNGPREYCLEIGPQDQTTVFEIAVLVRDIVQELGFKKVGIKHLPMRPGENNNALLSIDGAYKLQTTINNFINSEKNPKLLSITTGSLIRSLRNIVSADISTLDHLNFDKKTLILPKDGVKRTIQYYLDHKGVVWNDYN